MFCTKCGAQIEDGAKFCTSCGEPTDAQAPAAPAAPAPEAPAKEKTDVGATVKELGGKIGPFFLAVWAKVKEIAKNVDEKVEGVLGDKKMYAYAGVIGLVGLLIVIGAIAGLIPDDNGYLAYDAAIALDTNDDIVYMIKEGKTIKIKTDAEDVDGYKTSIDGKVTVFDNDGTLYVIKGKKAKAIAEDVHNYTLSAYGDAVVYTVVDGLETVYYYCKVSNGKSVEFFENEIDSLITSYVISPDGKSVSYVASDGLDADLYYFNGKKSEKVDQCTGAVVGTSNGGKYIYVTSINDEGKITLKSYNKKGKETKIDSCSTTAFAINLDGTQIMYFNGEKTYVSTKAKEPVKVAGSNLTLLTPDGTTPYYQISVNSVVYPVENLYNHVYTSGSTAYFVSKKESKNVKLVKADNSHFVLDDGAEFLYYIDDDELMVLDISKGENAKDKAKTIAKDVENYVVTSDRKYVYYVNDEELYVVNGKKGGKTKKLSTDDVSRSIAIDENDVVYYTSDDAVFATTGKKKGKKILDDADFGEIGGYVYLIDDDAFYGARGRSKPKKLIERE